MSDAQPKPARSWVYVLECADGTLYTGWSTDPDARLRKHNAGRAGAKFTRARRPVTLVYREQAADRSAALRREWEIKRMTRTQKLRLIGRAPHE